MNKLVIGILLGIGWLLASFMTWVAYELNQENRTLRKDNKVLVQEWSRSEAVHTELVLRGWSEDQIDEFIVRGCVDYYVGVGK